MANKNKKATPAAGIVKSFIILLFISFLFFISCKGAVSFLRRCDYFSVKDIWYESSLKAIESSELAGLKGKNLFDIDLKKVQRQLQLRYPQFKNLAVLKRFPNQILVVAKKRPFFAEVKINGRTVVIDEKGVVLSLGNDFGENLPLIIGMNSFKSKVSLGTQIENESLQAALDIMKAFLSDKMLLSHHIFRIDVGNLSEISFTIENNLKIIIDRENFGHKLRMLGFVLAQTKFVEPNNIKYIDLRFKEPILGKNDR